MSANSDYSALTPQQVKAKFGFQLLCEDLSKSVKETEKFSRENNITHSFPLSLKDIIKSYRIETNTLNLFVLHKTSSKMGFGISTYSALPKASIVAEYVGEMKNWDTKINDTTYLFLNTIDHIKVDSKDFGNVARFFNHCPQEHHDDRVLTANLQPLGWKASETSTKIFFMTLRDIKAFEPLCWDYGDSYNFSHSVELLNAETYLPITEFNQEL